MSQKKPNIDFNLFEQSAFFLSSPFVYELISSTPDLFLIVSGVEKVKYSSGKFLKKSVFRDFPLDGSEFIFGLAPSKIIELIDNNIQPGEFSDIKIGKDTLRISFYNDVFVEDNFEKCWVLHRITGRLFEIPIFVFKLRSEDSNLLVFALHDLNFEKKIIELERSIMSNILSSHTGRGIIQEMMARSADEQSFNEAMLDKIDDIIHEIKDTNELNKAERNQLQVRPKLVNSVFMLQTVIEGVHEEALKKGVDIELNRSSQSEIFLTDIRLLMRCLRTLAQNAINSSRPGRTIVFSCSIWNYGIQFSITHQEFMSEDEQLKIFQKWFSLEKTNKPNELYKIKLIVEKFLKGSVHFDTKDTDGTTFYITLPMNIEDDKPVTEDFLNDKVHSQETDHEEHDKKITDYEEESILNFIYNKRPDKG